MKLKKHPFILLELLIAISLVTTVILPFIDQPFFYLKEEVNSLVKMELERAAEAALVDIKGDLYQNKIDWETLTKRGSPSLPDLEKKIQISLPNNIQKTFLQQVYFCLYKQKKGQGDNELFLIHVRATFREPKSKKIALSIRKEYFIKQMPRQV